MDWFKIMLLVQLFYSFGITTMSYATPDAGKTYVTGFSGTTSLDNLITTTQDVQTNLERQTNIPLIEIGALVFYSGNILIDLLLNFLTATPQMLAMIVSGLQLIFSLDGQLFVIVELFAVGTVTLFYLLGIIQLLTGIRSGRIV